MATVERVSPRVRIALVVAVAALLAAAVAIGAGLLTREDAAGRGREGVPPYVLDLGVRGDPEARDLRRAARLYGQERLDEAARIFERHGSLQARIGLALSGWPRGTQGRLEQLSAGRPRSAAVRLHLGLAYFWAGRDADAAAEWRAASRVEPDSFFAVRASDLLHPGQAPGLPAFVPGFEPPAALRGLEPARQLALLRRNARRPDARAKLLYGVALQRLGRPRSAERTFAEAARLAPRDPETLTAAAVGRYRKEAPERTFSRLGPLTRRFPGAATVRFHLGMSLLWLGNLEEAKRQLLLARKAEPGSSLAREADRFLSRLEGVSRAKS
jgi:tetratricopeptide (TPR) repeat protein